MTSEEAKNPQDHWTFGDWMESRVVILNDNKELEADLAAARAEAARLRQAIREFCERDDWARECDVAVLLAALEEER